MQVLAGIICLLIILGFYKLACWLHYFMMEKAKEELLNHKHRKNGKDHGKEKS